MHYALCTWAIVGQEGLYVTGCYHLYLPNAPLPPLTGSCLPRKHQKYWRRRRQVCKICKKSNPSSTLQTLKRNQKKMLKGTNVSSSIPPFHLSHPFFTAVLLWAFNATSPRIRILVFLHRKPHHLLPREASRVKATSNCDIQNCLCHYRQQKYKRHEQTRVASMSKQETAFRKHVWKHIDGNIDTILICLSAQWASLIHFWSSLAKSGKQALCKQSPLDAAVEGGEFRSNIILSIRDGWRLQNGGLFGKSRKITHSRFDCQTWLVF